LLGGEDVVVAELVEQEAVAGGDTRQFGGDDGRR
jgi:hypothetical protein